MSIKAKASFKPGDAFYVSVEQESIDKSEPCNKDNCMVNCAFLVWARAKYGNRNFKAKSTNHGIVFELNGRKYVAVFDSKSAYRIYKYDQIFRTTRSKERARASVRPFTVRMMVEASTRVTKGPAMSEETKKQLKARKAEVGRKKIPHAPSRGKCRELSL